MSELSRDKKIDDARAFGDTPATWRSFYQVIRDVEQRSGVKLGSDVRFEKEPVRLLVDAESTFPVAELAKIRQGVTKPELEVSFFGLFGASGALPKHYSLLILDRIKQKDYALRDFLNIFNHRLLSLFYRAWEKHHFPISFETATRLKDKDRVQQVLWSLIGLQTGGLQKRLSVSDSAFLHYSAHFAAEVPRCDSLEAMLGQTFRVPIEVLQLVGQWVFLPASEQSRLGGTSTSDGWNQLGKDAVAGGKVWECQSRFRIRIGAVGFGVFSTLMPHGKRLRQVVDFTRRYVGPQYDFDVQVVLKKNEVPPLKLGGETGYLGWSTWLGVRQDSVDAEDAIFQLSDSM
jgi:type VI secretion system protein ImpH